MIAFMKYFAGIQIAALFTFLSASGLAQVEEHPVKVGSPISELEFEYAFGAGAPDAKAITMEELRGKVVVLEYWATW